MSTISTPGHQAMALRQRVRQLHVTLRRAGCVAVQRKQLQLREHDLAVQRRRSRKNGAYSALLQPSRSRLITLMACWPYRKRLLLSRTRPSSYSSKLLICTLRKAGATQATYLGPSVTVYVVDGLQCAFTFSDRQDAKNLQAERAAQGTEGRLKVSSTGYDTLSPGAMHRLDDEGINGASRRCRYGESLPPTSGFVANTGCGIS